MLVVMVRGPGPCNRLGADVVFRGDIEEECLVAHDVVDNPVSKIMRAHQAAQVRRMDTGLHYEFSKLLRVLRQLLQAQIGELGDSQGSRLEGLSGRSITAFVSV
jgi:hypothetical protein